MMKIKDLAPETRPRERMQRLGAEQLSDAELLAILLRTGTRQQSAIALAGQLLQHFGNLNRLFAATPSALRHIIGIGPAKQTEISAIMELAKRALANRLCDMPIMSSITDCEEYLKSWLANRSYEVFAALFLNTRHYVLAAEELFRGTIDSVEVHPREILQRVLHHQAAAVIFVHNHPSGMPDPSISDIQLTKRLVELLHMINVRVLDHMVIAGGKSFSMAAAGILPI